MSTPTTEVRRKPAALLAIVTSFLVVLSGLFFAPTAASAALVATVTPSVTVTGTGLSVVVTATDIPGPIYAAIIEKDTEANVGQGGGYVAFAYQPPITNGAANFTLNAATADLNRNTPYEVLIWQSHNEANADTIYGRADLNVTAEQWDQLFPPAPVAVATTTTVTASSATATEGTGVDLTATVSPADAAGSVTFKNNGAAISGAEGVAVSGGAATAAGIVLPLGTNSISAEFTPSDAAAHEASQSAEPVVVTVSAVSAPAAPAVVVSKTSGVDPDGETITVTGTGFFPDAPATNGTRQPLNGKFGGAYVQFGYYDGTTWKGGSTSNPELTKWAVSPEDVAALGVAAIPMVEGGFVAELKPVPVAAAPEGAVYGFRTYGGSGSTYAPFETFTPITFADPEAPTFSPAIKVYLEDGITEYDGRELEKGDKLVVKGTGFDPSANVPGGSGGVPIPNALPQGTFVVFGNFAENWRPSQGVTDTSKRLMASSNRGWALDPAVMDQVPTQFQQAIRNGGYVPLSAAGEFTWSVTLDEPSTTLADGRWGIYTYAGGASGITNAAQEIYVPIDFKATTSSGGGDDENQAQGGLQWAFKSSWNNYLTYGASGTTTVSNGATKGAGGVIGYEQASQNYNTTTGKGNIVYRGTVQYTSTAHGFDIALKDPWITFTASGATLTAEVSTSDTSGTSSMSRVIVANLDDVQPTTAADGTITWAGVDGIFTDSLQPSTWNGNYKGQAIEPVTFTLGSNAGGGASTPWIQAAPSTGLKDGDSITVTGGNLDTVTAAAHGAPGTKAGVYVQLGWVKGDNWSPSKGGVNGTDRKGVKSAWVTNTGATQWTDATGSFEVEFDDISKEELTAGMPAGARLAVFTTVAGGASPNADYEMVQYIEFANVDDNQNGNGNGGTGGTGNQGGTTGSETVGSMRWGVKASFVSYMNGLSDGSITSSGVGGGVGNWLFPQSGSNWNTSSGTGTVSYSGTVTFSGHGMTMLTLSNPVIQVTSAQNATLSSSGVHIANLNLAAASRSTGSGGAVTWTSAPATLTAAGASFFSGYYTAGTVLDPVTFTVGAVNTTNFGSTLTPSAASQTRTPAAAPPATTGIELETAEDELVEGGDIEFTASGFEPNETGILIVIYSEPTVLDTNAKADANGVLRWIGTLPKGLSGTHTLTAQGSISVGKVIEIMSQDEFKAAQAKGKKLDRLAAEADGDLTEAAAGPASGEGSNAWVLWAGAIALLIVAGGMTALVVAQRRRNSVE